MKKVMRKYLSKFYRSAEYLLKTFIIVSVRKLTFKSNASLTLTFDSSRCVDGTGAQLQRMISIYALAKYFGFAYLHSDIKQISIHPLDPFQTDELYQSYLSELNDFIVLNHVIESTHTSTALDRYDIHFWRFISLLLRNRLRMEAITLSVLEPYSVTEFRPAILDTVRNDISIRHKTSTGLEQPYIVIHYRQGVGGFALYPGQNIARETPLAQFEGALYSIFSDLRSVAFKKLVVLTDAPTEITHYRPPVNQQQLWEGTPGYSAGVMTIQPINFDDLARKFDIPVEIIRGGNPLDAIEIMARSEFLFMSKSSLSYLGGYLNKQGFIYCPYDFWHRPLPGWKGF
jgi:hypothetical protein